MAEAYKKQIANSIGTTEVTLYTVPGSTTAMLIGFMLANITSELVSATIEVGGMTFGKDIPIPAGSAISLLDGKIVLEAADTVKITSSTVDSLDSILGYMEIT